MDNHATQSKHALHAPIVLLNIIGVILSIIFMFYIGQPDSFSIWFFTIAIMILLAIPYILFLIINAYFSQHHAAATLVFILSFLALIYAGVMFFYGFIIDVKGQNGLFLFYVPLLQFTFAIIAALLCLTIFNPKK